MQDLQPYHDPQPLDDPSATRRYAAKSEEILAAAALVFNQLGIKGGTLAEAARRVGLATNSVTYYYRKKEDLASACFLRSIEVHRENIRAAALRPGIIERVTSLFEIHAGLLADIATGEHAPLIVFNEIRALDGPLQNAAFDAYTQMFRDMRALLEGPETSGLSRTDLNARTHILVSSLNWMRAWIGKAEPACFDHGARRCADIVLHGIAAGNPAWPARDIADPQLVAPDDTPADRFLRAATALLNEQGYRGASVDRISARLNVTKGSFYHHIDRKQDLIVACFERTLEAVRRAATLAESADADGWTRIVTMARALVRFQVSEQGPMLRVSALGSLLDNAGRAQAYRELMHLTDRMADLFVDGLIDGSVRPLDAQVAAHNLTGTINAAAECPIWVRGFDEELAMASYLRPQLLGLLCPPAGAT